MPAEQPPRLVPGTAANRQTGPTSPGRRLRLPSPRQRPERLGRGSVRQVAKERKDRGRLPGAAKCPDRKPVHDE